MGFTREQCIEQYGSAVEVTGKDRSGFKFRKSGFEIEVVFQGDHVAAILYKKPGRYSNEQILKVERDRLVWLNADGYNWEKMECPRKYYDQHFMSDLWRRSDGALACYNPKDYTLTIVSAGFDSIIFSDGKASTSGL